MLLSEQLKQETKLQHQQLEALVVKKLKNIRTENDYAGLLKKFYGFHQPVEQVLDQYLNEQIIDRYDRRRKATAIEKDLVALQQPATTSSMATDLPGIHNVAAAMGVYYVLEGSTQGGSIIAGMMNKLANIPYSAMNFFNPYPGNEKEWWMSYKSKLDAVSSEEEKQIIINAAKETFEKFRDWMSN